jgi:hypothetical protein
MSLAFAGIHLIGSASVRSRTSNVLHGGTEWAVVTRRVERTVGRHVRDLGTLRGVPEAGWTPSPTPAASEAERNLILRMLEQKKITADEADRLLAALEGQA